MWHLFNVIVNLMVNKYDLKKKNLNKNVFNLRPDVSFKLLQQRFFRWFQFF